MESSGEDVQSLMPLRLPQSIIIAGATKSGKSTFVKKILLSMNHMFDQDVEEVIFVYTVWQPIYEELEAKLKDKIKFRQDIPSKSEVEALTADLKQRVMVLDDKQSQLSSSAVSDFVTIFCSHRNLSTFILLQNFYYGCKHLRTISLNVQTIVLFKNYRSAQQVKTLAAQMLPGNSGYMVDAYNKATASNPHGYLLIDLDPRTDKVYQFRTKIFNDEDMIVFHPEKPS